MPELRVCDLMTKSPEVLEESDDVDFAAMLMRLERFRHLPVVTDGKLVGVVSQRDILRAQSSTLSGAPTGDLRKADLHTPVRRIMTRNPRTISPATSALEAALILREHKFGCLPVVEDDELVGIITETDFLNLAIGYLTEVHA